MERIIFCDFRKPLLTILQSFFFCLLSPFYLLTATESPPLEDGTARLQTIHSNLHLIHGSLAEEYPEQLMSAMYIPKEAKVLELGGHLGRNSCVIGSILEDSKNLVTLEPCKEYAKLLQDNRDNNDLEFHIEGSALSKVPLIQYAWTKVTIPSEKDLPEYTRVDTITFDDLQKKYEIEFDTFVIDCEGALYYVLIDFPEILENMKLVLIENDFTDVQHFQYVQDKLTDNGFRLVFNQAGGWGPCFNHFYQVWVK